MTGNNLYEPLPQEPFSIRLLKVEPGVDQGDVRCSLSVFSLNDAAQNQYEALSYVWGSSDAPDHVFCNGQRRRVTRNLGLALRRIRRPDKARDIWVDALCINQSAENHTELAQQVARMRDIYSNATKVLIWLGEDATLTAESALALVRKAAGLAKAEAGSAVPRPGQITSEYPSADENLRRGFPAVDDPAWTVLLDLFNRAWFERVWIIQEVSTFTESLAMVGACDICWIDIALAAMWFSIKGYNGLVPGMSRITLIIHIWKAREHRDSEPVPLINHLNMIRSFKATKPQDKIYAVLGISFEGFHRNKYPRLKVDYQKPFIDVYTDVVRHCLEHPELVVDSKHKLGVLSLVQPFIGDEDDVKVSWVPRWDRPNQSWILGLQPYARFFNASGTLDTCIGHSGTKRALFLGGLDIDKVDTVDHCLGKVASNSREMFMAIKKLWKSVIVEYKRHQPNYLGVVNTERTFARTVTAGSTIDRLARSPEQYDEHDFAAYWRSNVENAHHNLETDSDDMGIFPKAAPSPPDRGLSFGETVCRNRVFFTTANRAMGIGPETTRAGDRICVLFGSVTPFILRAVGEHFQLVGECFSSGLMRGEAIAAMEAGIVKKRVFELQ